MIESKWSSNGDDTHFHRPENFKDLESLKEDRPLSFIRKY